LRLPHGGFNAGNVLAGERRVVALGDERDLIFQVGQAVVDRPWPTA